MNNELMYSFRDSNVRVVMKDNEPWFVAKDVCEILGLNNVSQAVNRLNDKNRGIISNDGAFGLHDLLIINEPGLYQFIFSSRKEEAELFKDWVFEEVLPSIRKTGSYAQSSPMSMLEIMRMQVEQLINQDRELQQVKSKQIEIETKVDNFHDVIKANSDNWRTETSTLIKRIANNMGGTHMIRDVHNRVYEALESRGKCNLDIRLSNFKKRCEHLGVPTSKVNAKNKLDVIAEDAKLVEIYVAIVKEYAIKGGF